MYSPHSRWVRSVVLGLLLAASPNMAAADHTAAQTGDQSTQSVRPAPPDTIVVGSIGELLDAIDRRNPELAAARYGARSLGSDAESIQTLPDPAVGLTLLPFPIHTARGEQQFQLRAEQMIPWPGKTALDRSVAELRADASGAASEEVFLDVRTTALGLMVDLARIDALEAAIRAYMLRLEDLEQVAAVRYEVGQGPQSAIVKSQVERSDLDLRLAALRSARRSALADLEAAVGGPIRLAFDPATEQTFSASIVESLSSDSLLAVAVESRPAFERIRILDRQWTVSVDRAKLNLKPDFGVGLTWFGIADSDIPPSSDGRDALGVGFSIRVPLHRQQKRADVEKARLSARQTEETLRTLVTSTRSAIERQIAEIRSASEQLELFRTSLIPQAELSAATSLRAYESGTATYLDLLDAERTLFRLRTSRIETGARLRIHHLRLDRLIGDTRSSY